ncbi:fimbrial protein [Hafnia paralvei]|uniref:Fimbrial protein n=1 Tax=Hafnia paralvei TaxID=546367 RepID=A0A4Q9ETM5_9GAMM|nr:fimbrial protein [Hafnia paralvei]TBM28792.1 fimbrial protein [Hafnia paralvei]
MENIIAGVIVALLFSFAAQAAIPDSINVDSGLISVVDDPSTSSVVPFGKYVFSSAPIYMDTDDCPDEYLGDSIYCSITFLNNSTFYNINSFVDMPEYTAFKIIGGQGFYVAFGIRDSKGDHYWSGGSLKINERNFRVIMSIFTPESGTDKIGTLDKSGTLATLRHRQQGSEVFTAVNAHINISIKESACIMQNSLNQAFHWDNITPSSIINGNVSTQQAKVTIKCSGSELHSMMFKLMADTGSDDASEGILKTDLNNLGIKLTWADSGNTIPFDKEMVFPGDTSNNLKDFSINAQPVSINGGAIPGGTFRGAATMIIEYR